MSLSSQPRGTFFAIALIVAGAILFFDNIGILPVDNIGAYWPLAFVVYGVGLIVRKVCATSLIWAATLIAFGVILTLGNLGILHATFAVAWPLLLIAFGVIALVHRSYWANLNWTGSKWPLPPGTSPGTGPNPLWWDKRAWRPWRREQRRRRWQSFAEGYTESGVNGNWVHEDAVFFSAKRQMAGREISGGELVSVFGSIEIDFRGANIALTVPADTNAAPVRRAEIEATAVFGSVEIRVPQTWRVVKNGTGVFGSYEDKTLPSRPEPGVEQPTLFIHGGAVFGSVTIESC
jgi:hypothetical protein